MGFGEIQLHYHIPWTSFKSGVHKTKIHCNLKELMFHNSSIFNVSFTDNWSVLICYFCISLFNSFIINSFFLDSIIFKFSKVIPIVYQSPNSIDFE